MSVLLTVKGLTKVFKLHLLGGKEVTACREVSFSVHRGELLGIKGPSGAGKSTILKCIYRTYLPSKGEALYYSKREVVDLFCLPEEDIISLRRGEIGYVSQFLRVVPRISAQQVVAEELLLQGWKGDHALEEARRLLAYLQIPKDLWEASPNTFSGGEQQRINIARAVARRPRLLLMDEPTASLDPQSKLQVRKLILELQYEGTSVIYVSHDLETLQQMADYILHLEHRTEHSGKEVSYVEDAY